MQLKVKIYSCYKRTYEPICNRILKFLYGEDVDLENVIIEIEDTSENNTKNIK